MDEERKREEGRERGGEREGESKREQRHRKMSINKKRLFSNDSMSLSITPSP